MTTIKILIDNRPNPELCLLKCEHGFSALIQTDNGKKILCDMGLSGAFYNNAQYLNEDLSTIDVAFISHGHKDHSGGLYQFLEINNLSKIYLSSHICNTSFYSYRHGNKRNISTDNNLLSSNSTRFSYINKSIWIDDNIAIIRNTVNKYPQPAGNKHLTYQTVEIEKPDDFSHELSLVIKNNSGLTIISPCSHNGVINIIKSAQIFTREKRVNTFIGGMHLVDSCELSLEVSKLKELILTEYSNTAFYTGHCTCDNAISALINDTNIHSFYTGMTITVK